MQMQPHHHHNRLGDGEFTCKQYLQRRYVIVLLDFRQSAKATKDPKALYSLS